MFRVEVLLIEDEPDSVREVRTLLKEYGHNCPVVGFNEAEETIRTVPFDIVILDIRDMTLSAPSFPGGGLLQMIWEEKFCPVIVYSALREEDIGFFPPHPFVKYVQKGMDSPEQVMTSLEGFVPYLEALEMLENQMKEHVRKQLSLAMKHVAPNAFRIFPDAADTNKRTDMVIRVGRRRLAALMDIPAGEILANWEQYILPPISKDPELGDILQQKGRLYSDPSSFRVILTPSCDMVASGGRKPKVEFVLVAKCCSIKEGMGRTPKKGAPPNTLEKFLGESVLSQGYFKELLPCPGFMDRIPPMFANLRDLELIPLKKITGNDPDFERIASVDSPFRELISWAYMQIACRPGIPDRDIPTWCGEIINAYSDGNDGDKDS